MALLLVDFDPCSPWFLIPLTLVLAVLTLVFDGLSKELAARRTRKRHDALAAMAAALPMPFTGIVQHSVAPMAWFQRGSNRLTFNTLLGEWRGCALQAGDFHYQAVTTNRNGGRSVRYYDVSYCLAPVANAQFPALTIRPEDWSDTAVELIGVDDIDFESHEFSRRYFVESADRKFAYDLITPAMMELLLAHTGYSIQVQGGHVLVLRGERRWTPEEFAPALDFAASFVSKIPTHLRDPQRPKPPAPA